MSVPPNRPTPPFRVLMVCTGNICRSTMAQEVLDEDAAAAGLDVQVDSAGISDEERGNPIDPRAARVLRDAGRQVPDHRARRVRADELGEWDLVLAMTRSHRDRLERVAARAGVEIRADAAPGAPDTVDIRMFRDFDPLLTPQEDPDVPDPWYGGPSDFVDTLRVIERVTPAIVGHIEGLVR